MNYSPAKTLLSFFLGLIAIGTITLSLPISRNPEAGFSFLTSLFTAASAVCVTGLTVVPINEYFSQAGLTIIMLLVQFGGLGYMFVSMAVALLIGKMALKDRRIMQEIFDISSFKDLKKLLIKAVFFVLAIETAGAVILTFIFFREFTFFESCYLGIFHSITAFCNAGFSPFADSLVSFSANPLLLYTIASLIILGGLGFFVIVDVYDAYKEKHVHLSTHTKVVLSMTLGIIVCIFIFFLFSKETGIFKGHGIFYAINNSFFQAVSARTAGFASVPSQLFSEFAEVVLIFFMSIGAAPGSTAGGIKITTLALVFIFVRSMIRADGDFVIFKRRIPEDLVKKALTIFVIFFTAAVLLSAALVLLEPGKRSIDVVFEVVSAFGTVGLSVGITPGLSVGGKILIIFAMIAGRIGVLTILILMLTSGNKKKSIKYPEARILVG
ncbi:MAG: Trk family potassium uptake protein [Endomicrobia bacterium]|nr:Trk family potassium uptake protein [Endomicrobiia bacterium]